MEAYSLRIENILCQISPITKGLRGLIAKDPFSEIIKVLDGRVSVKYLDEFKKYYSGIDGMSMEDLIEDNFDIEKLILDLKYIIESK